MILSQCTSASLPSKKRILTVCVKLFEQGYKKTTVAQIVHEAGVSNSTFQNIFRAKDGVLTELVEFMFGNQFAMARQDGGADAAAHLCLRGRDSHSDDASQSSTRICGNLS